MKTFLVYTGLTLLNFAVCFFIFNYSFNQQATPFLVEEQRVESGLLMLQTTLPAYLLWSIIVSLVFYWISRKLKSHR
ncbi:MAG: hypothetical protein ACI832_000713 [Rheinheimera aquimaris]|jgi:hypothetical protein|uniref:hypothetical protein n=1 Tax=Rheinheimera aquimaris TaxID=412437 RepID=UPI000E925EBA|nr:hypothetical protein [Rheinheimera sp.]|tara:strand:+ start:628 stop:858 length:231 start_codon:yes stop_codon:yes gene_type:complete